jgi:hypothetical protein
MSGRKNVIPAYHILPGGDLSDDFVTEAVTMTTATNISFTVSTSGVTDNTGSFGIEYRIYKDENHYGAWIPLTFSPVPTLADANALLLIQAYLNPGQARLTFIAAGGTPDGEADVWVTGEQGT